MRVTHLISNLEAGGAENSLCTLVEGTRAAGTSHTVISVLPGILRSRLEGAGATVGVLDARRGAAGALMLPAVARALRQSRPDVVQAWMYHANIAASLIALSGYVRSPLLWGVRQGADDIALDRALTRLIIRSGALLSAQPHAIVYNSEQAAQTHERLGYRPSKRIVIPNGVDSERFRPCPDARQTLLAELKLPNDAVLIGRVARLAPMKDYPTMLRAFGLLLATHPEAQLVLVGDGISAGNHELASLCRALGCGSNVHPLGPRLDIEVLYQAFDLLVSSSKANEGFPNSVAEALACGTLVVSTSVGDPVLIRDGCHLVVPPNEPQALADGMASLLSVSPSMREGLAARGRDFILNNFDSATFAARFVEVYRATIEAARV